MRVLPIMMQLTKKKTLALAIGAILLALVGMPIVSSLRSTYSSAQVAVCDKNMKIIALALLSYHQTYGCFPPSYTVDGAGRPMHSWRTIILPYVAPGMEVTRRYRFDEPWDSRNNRQLRRLVPECYRCPAELGADRTTTSYVAVVGQHAGWEDAKALRFSDFKDGIGDTITLVEVADSGINWMEPRDLTLERALAGVNLVAKPCISSHHSGGANVVTGAGSVRFLHDSVSLRVLRGLLTRDGNKDKDVRRALMGYDVTDEEDTKKR